MKKLALILAVILFATTVYANEYVCNVCYEPVPVEPDVTICDVVSAQTYEQLQEAIVAAASVRDKVEKMTIDCNFAKKTDRGFTGYLAEITFKH